MNSEALLIQEFIHFSGCKIFPQSQTTNHTTASPNSKGLQIDCPCLINLLRAHKILDEVQVRQRTIEALFNGHKAKHERKISFQAFKRILEALAPAKFPCFENPTSALIEHIIAKRRAHLAVNSHLSSSALKQQQQQQSKNDNSPYGANPSVFERLSDERLFPAAYKRHNLSEHSLATVSPTSKSSASSVANSTKAVCSLEGKMPAVYARLTDPTFYRKVHPAEKDAILSGQS